MKNIILFLVVTVTLFGCSNSDDFIDPPQKEVTYSSFNDCKQDLSVTQCQMAIDNQQKQQDKNKVGFANRDASQNNAIANPPTVVECDKEKKDSTEKPSDKCNTTTSSSRSSVYPAYVWGYAGNSGMGLQSPTPSPSQQPVKPFSVTVPESTPTSYAITSRSIASSAKTSISRGGLGSSGMRFRGGAGG